MHQAIINSQPVINPQEILCCICFCLSAGQAESFIQCVVGWTVHNSITLVNKDVAIRPAVFSGPNPRSKQPEHKSWQSLIICDFFSPLFSVLYPRYLCPSFETDIPGLGKCRIYKDVFTFFNRRGLLFYSKRVIPSGLWIEVFLSGGPYRYSVGKGGYWWWSVDSDDQCNLRLPCFSCRFFSRVKEKLRSFPYHATSFLSAVKVPQANKTSLTREALAKY